MTSPQARTLSRTFDGIHSGHPQKTRLSNPEEGKTVQSAMKLTSDLPIYSSLPLPAKLPPPPGTPPIRTQQRAATILPNFVGLKFAVHNGKNYQDVFITEEMVGRKLGEYAP